MFTLIEGGEIFSPEPIGIKDILIGGEKILAIKDSGEIKISGIEIEKVDAKGKKVIPGFIDPHVHILGGGGEGGPTTRAPEITLSNITKNGVTTLVGCLGTDSITRHMESLLTKAIALEKEGITTFIYSGAYQLPLKTLTGSILSDLVLIDKVIGAGEVAISDHRSSQPSFKDIAKLAAQCRVGGMLSGKAGVLHLHVGDGEDRLDYLFRLVKETEIPVTQLYPTHVNRNPYLLEHAVEFANLGGYIDITAEEEPPASSRALSTKETIEYLLKKGVSMERITVSSDSNGSLPLFDEKGTLIGLTIATQETLRKGFFTLIKENILDFPKAVKIFSTNSAHFLKLRGKGKIQINYDADILLIDKDFEITDVFARGKRMIANKKLLVKGTFER